MSQAGITRTATCVAHPSTARKSSSRSSGATCLESFSSAERAYPVILQQLVVEQDARDDERPRQRASPRLVRAGDEAGAEAAVEAEEALSGGGLMARG